MATRETLFTNAAAVLMDGNNLALIGDRGSGRTWLMDRLRSHARNHEWTVVSVQGIRAYKSTPLVGLSLSGIASARDSRPSAVVAAVEELSQRVGRGRAAIFVDDWEDLDEVSWGVVCAVHREYSVPIVYARSRGRVAPGPTSPSATKSIRTPHVIDVGSMRFDEIALALHQRLGQPVEEATLSRVYAKSGGNIGLALAIAENAVRRQALKLLGGEWVASDHLWSSSLGGLAESFLEPLDSEQRDALEIFSLLGVVDIAAVESLIDAPVLETLESLGLIELYSAGRRVLINVRPPLLIEYFRHMPNMARRQRLLAQINRRLDPENRVAVEPLTTSPASSRTAQFVRFVHEHARMQRLVARTEWAKDPSAETANTYLKALVAARVTTDEIDQLLSSERIEGDERSVVAWLANKATVQAIEHQQPAEAVAALRQSAPELPTYGGILLARAVELEHLLVGNGKLETLPDPFDTELDDTVRIEVHTVHALVHASRGEISLAEKHLAAVYETGSGTSALTDVLVGLCYIARGDLDSATRLANQGLEEARARFDSFDVRAFGYLAVLCAFLEGRYDHVDELVETALALGEPMGRIRYTHLAIQVVASVLASRRGKRSLAVRRMVELERSILPDGPHPATFRALATAQIQASEGNPRLAATTISDAAERLWERGYRYSAAFGFLAAVEIAPSREALERAQRMVAHVESAFLQQQLEFMTALVNKDAGAMEAAAARLADSGQIGLALNGYAQAAGAYSEAGEQSKSAAALAAQRALMRTLPNRSFDANRFDAPFIELTDRELEVVRLAASGLTNKQIAAELVLSVRTVESHLHRVTRKTGYERRELRELLERTDSRA